MDCSRGREKHLLLITGHTARWCRSTLYILISYTRWVPGLGLPVA